MPPAPTDFRWRRFTKSGAWHWSLCGIQPNGIGAALAFVWPSHRDLTSYSAALDGLPLCLETGGWIGDFSTEEAAMAAATLVALEAQIYGR